MDKAPDAFRTISEVAEDLDVPQHVLRFWETRFGQIKPLKRGGGRRYYRPDDVDLLRGIRHLLYGEGYTIRGVQRILKDNGLKFVQSVWTSGAPQPAAARQADEIGAQGGFEHGEPGHLDGGALPGSRLSGGRVPNDLQNRSDEIRVADALRREHGAGREDNAGAPHAHAAPSFDARPFRERSAAEYATVEDGITDDGTLEDIPPDDGEEPAGAPDLAGLGAGRRPVMHPPEPLRRPEDSRRSEASPPVAEPHRAAEVLAGRAAAALSADDRRRLQATLFELDECRRILDAALKDEA